MKTVAGTALLALALTGCGGGGGSSGTAAQGSAPGVPSTPDVPSTPPAVPKPPPSPPPESPPRPPEIPPPETPLLGPIQPENPPPPTPPAENPPSAPPPLPESPPPSAEVFAGHSEFCAVRPDGTCQNWAPGDVKAQFAYERLAERHRGELPGQGVKVTVIDTGIHLGHWEFDPTRTTEEIHAGDGDLSRGHAQPRHDGREPHRRAA